MTDAATTDATSERGELQSLVRGIRILELFNDPGRDNCRIDEVVERLGVPLSTAYRLVRVLKQHGLLENAGGRGGFRLGPRLRQLGEKVRGEDRLLARLRPMLEELREQTGETILLTVRQGDEAVHVDVLDSPQEVRVSIPRGRRTHIAAGGSGRTILAHLPAREITRILAQDLPSYTPHTLTDGTKIRAELRAVRARGYAVSESQTTNGTRGVCVPVLDREGQPIAAITATGPSFRMTDERTADCLAAVQRVVARLAR